MLLAAESPQWRTTIRRGFGGRREKDDLAERILRGTVSLDDYESPKKKQPWKLPLTARIPSTQQDYRYLSRTTPSPPRATSRRPVRKPFLGPAFARAQRGGQEPESEPAPKRKVRRQGFEVAHGQVDASSRCEARTYAGVSCAARNILVRSSQVHHWLARRRCRSRLYGDPLSAASACLSTRAHAFKPRGRCRPVAVRAAPVICDSASNDAADLPPFRPRSRAPAPPWRSAEHTLLPPRAPPRCLLSKAGW